MVPETIEHRNARLAAIVDHCNDAIISKDLNGNITSWNKASERIFGYSDEEVLGKSITILMPSDKIPEEAVILMKIRDGKIINHYETIRRTKSGAHINISLTVSPIYIGDKIVGASKIARDITVQKAVENNLRSHTVYLEILNNISNDILSKLDPQDVAQKVSDAGTALLNADFGAFFYSKTDERGTEGLFYGISGVIPRNNFDAFAAGLHREVLSRSGNFGESWCVGDITLQDDLELLKNSFHPLQLKSILAVPVISRSRDITGLLLFGSSHENAFSPDHIRLIKGIAGQAAVALDNAKLFDEVNLLNKRKNDFIGFASHELKTPLTIMSGYVQMSMQNPALSNQFMPQIAKQIARFTAIISDLLDITKIESGTFEYNFEFVGFGSLIRDSLDAIESLHPERNFQLLLPEHPCNVKADVQKFGQVILNILTNAVKYSASESAVIIECSVHEDELQIGITDHGIGMPEEHLLNIFDLFYRVPDAKHKAHGLGIGLYLSKEIIDAHAGKIWVRSAPGAGSTFFISLPLQ